MAKQPISQSEAERLARTMKVARRSASWWIVSSFCPDMGPYDRKADAIEDLAGVRRTFLKHPEMLAEDYGRPSLPPIRLELPGVPRKFTAPQQLETAKVKGHRRRGRRPSSG